MRILVLGGTRLSGPHVVRELVQKGHEVTVFHRGQEEGQLPDSVSHLHGDRKDLRLFREEFTRLSPDVVIDMLAFTRQDAEALVQTFRGITRRVVVASSIDVYRAFGRLHGTEPGTPDPVPLSEDAPLRSRLSIHGEAYEKRWVEEVVLRQAGLTASVLRLPAIHGPGDYRVYYHLKRMDAGRLHILMDERMARWRFSRGYSENVAQAVVLAVLNEKAAGKVYNIADQPTLTQLEWVHMIARTAGWGGRILVLPAHKLPDHLKPRENLDQHWEVDTGRIRADLGYAEKVSFEEGVRRTVDWTRENPPPPEVEARIID